MARTAFASVRAMSLSPSDAPSPAHPRFARALADLGLAVPVTTLIEHAQGRIVDVRERSS